MTVDVTPRSFQGEVLVAGEAGSGPALVLSAPISFWGGVDPTTGTIVDVRHPEHGETIAGRVLFLPATIGSSSASAVLMEPVAVKLDRAVFGRFANRQVGIGEDGRLT